MKPSFRWFGRLTATLTLPRVARPAVGSRTAIRWFVLALLAACASPSHPVPVYEASDEPPPPPPPEPTEGAEVTPPPRPVEAVREPFLYAVRSAEGAPPSLIFATLTSGVSFDQAFPAHRLDLLDQARVVYVAFDPTTPEPDDVQRALQLRRGSAADLFPARVWHALTEELRLVTPVEQLRGARPFYSVMALERARREGLEQDAPEPMETTFVRYVIERGRELQSFDTVVADLQLLGTVPDSQFVALGTRMVDDRQGTDHRLTAMRQAYLDGDEIQISQLLDDPEVRRLAPALVRTLARRRTEWLTKMRREIEQGTAFFALDVSHVLGAEGLLAKLREAGFTVERLD